MSLYLSLSLATLHTYTSVTIASASSVTQKTHLRIWELVDMDNNKWWNINIQMMKLLRKIQQQQQSIIINSFVVDIEHWIENKQKTNNYLFQKQICTRHTRTHWSSVETSGNFIEIKWYIVQRLYYRHTTKCRYFNHFILLSFFTFGGLVLLGNNSYIHFDWHDKYAVEWLNC